MSAVLSITQLTKVYSNGVRANDNISFAVGAGVVLGLLGDNGAGKTTLVRQLVGLTVPTSGTIELNGVDAIARPALARQLCSMQAQSQVPITGLTPRQAITLVGRLRGEQKTIVNDRTVELATRLNFDEWLDSVASHTNEVLTGGIRRLVAFCMAVVAPGPLVVLDEPTNDVDPIRRRLLWAEIRRLADDGHAVVLVTHNVVEAERSVDRIMILHRGRVIADGSPASLVTGVCGMLRVDVTWATTILPELPPFLNRTNGTTHSLTATLERAFLEDVVAWSKDMREQGVIEHFAVSATGLEDAYDQILTGAKLQQVPAFAGEGFSPEAGRHRARS